MSTVGEQLAIVAEKSAKKLEDHVNASRNALKADLRDRVIKLAREAAESGKRYFYLRVGNCYLRSLSDSAYGVEEELWKELKKNDCIKVVKCTGSTWMYVRKEVTCDKHPYNCPEGVVWFVSF